MAPTLKQVAYDHLRRKLLDGALVPGARLSTRSIAAELGISLIPVREAISQLATEGLVEHQPGAGAFVRQPTHKELEDLYEVREVLECHALEVAAGPRKADALAHMRSCNRDLEQIVEELESGGRDQLTPDMAERWIRADAELHLSLLRATGNDRMTELIGSLRIMAQVFGRGRPHRTSIESRRRICTEHAHLIDAIAEGDAQRARLELQEHIRTGCREAKVALEDRMLESVRTPANAKTSPGG